MHQLDNYCKFLKNLKDDDGPVLDGSFITPPEHAKVFLVLGLPGEGMSVAANQLALHLAQDKEQIRSLSHDAFSLPHSILAHGEPSNTRAFDWITRLVSPAKRDTVDKPSVVVVDSMDSEVPMCFHKSYGTEFAKGCNTSSNLMVISLSTPPMVEAMLEQLDSPPAILLLKGRTSLAEWMASVNQGITPEQHTQNKRRIAGAIAELKKKPK